MSNQNKRDEMIDKRLDEFNASSALEGLDLSEPELAELKAKLKNGKSVDECVKEIISEHKNP